jgi:hypothetical protein
MREDRLAGEQFEAFVAAAHALRAAASEQHTHDLHRPLFIGVLPSPR